MLDDEIVFLGSSKAHTGARPVTGITLHVQKNGNVDAHTLTFRRANTSVIEIGRRSGADVDPDDDDELENAMFRCAVVSRKHAKIAFTDAGKACLIDRNSHHGTHVRKAGETVSKMIKPETYTLLADGDTVTFGKAVGKGDDAVPPIVVRVELHYAAEHEAIKPTSTSSGHYGLKDHSSSSDEASSNNYSDIEEIDAPVEKKQPSFTSALGSMLQRLPPLWLSRDHTTEDDSVLLPPPRGYLEEESVPSLHAGHFVASNEWDHDDVESSDEGSSSPRSRSRSNSPMELASPSPAPVEPVDPPQPNLAHPMPMPPMCHGLSWPPPAMHLPLPPVTYAPLPSCMRMLPPPPPSFHGPPPPPPHAPLRVNPADPQGSPQIPTRLVPPPWVLQPKPTGPPPPALLPERPVDHSPEDDAQSLNESDAENNNEHDDDRSMMTSDQEMQLADIEERLATLETTTDKLQMHRRKYRKKFNTNVEIIDAQLADVDDRISEVDAECTVLFERVERLHEADVPELQGQMESVQERLDALDETDKARATELASIVESIKQLKADTEKKMAADLAEVKALLEQAKQAVQVRSLPSSDSPKRDFTWAPGPQTPVLPSLKRKRDDIDENGEEDDGPMEQPTTTVVDVEKIFADAGGIALDPRVDVLDMLDCASTDALAHSKSESEPPRPRKRARRIASALAQSATALTIGAVVTWSALAFS